MPPTARVLTEEEKIQVEALASVLTTEQLADYLGMARQTFYDIMERDPSVSVHYKKGKSKAVANIAGNLVKKAQEGNVSAQIFFLKTQAGWHETQIIEASTGVSILIDQQDEDA